MTIKCTECLGFINRFTGDYQFHQFHGVILKTIQALEAHVQEQLRLAKPAVLIHEGKGLCIDHIVEKARDSISSLSGR